MTAPKLLDLLKAMSIVLELKGTRLPAAPQRRSAVEVRSRAIHDGAAGTAGARSTQAFLAATMNHSPWLVTRPREHRPFRLYCFSYAGGSASAYMPWQSLIDPSVQIYGIQLPGREGRMAELPWTSMSAIVKTIADVISVQDPGPFAVFGHSLGGFIAFEVARELRRMQACLPSHLFLSGCVAPHCMKPSRLHALSDDDLIDALREYNGTPEEILGNGPLMALLLPTIRADSALFAGYRFEAGPPLDVPLSIFAGKTDPRVPIASARAWSAYACGDVDFRVFDGDHFFIRSERVKVVNRISETLRACHVW